LCVKFYRDPKALSAGTSLSVRGELIAARFLRSINVNFLEWTYHQSLQRRLPPELLSVFPEHVELAYSAIQGWGIVESLITSLDGSPAQCLIKELPHVADPALRLRIYRETEALLHQIATQGIKFYDIPNLLLQWTGDTSFRLRIADFEPRGRGGWAWLSCCRPLSQYKVRRRSARYLAKLREIIIETDGAAAAAAFATDAASGTGSAHGLFFLRFARMAGLL
jgi:hypothetical protein